MKTFLKLSVLLVMLAIGMVLVTIIESRQQYGSVPKTPPTTQQINNIHLQQHPNEK
jgi:CHASE3 domain sensor protein